MKRPKALIVGIDPTLIDFAKGGYGPRPGLDAADTAEAIRRRLAQHP